MMNHRRWIPVAALALLLVLPSAAFACPACLDLTSENRMAFVQTAVALTLLPFGLMGGLGMWLRKRLRNGEAVDEESPSRPAESGEPPREF